MFLPSLSVDWIYYLGQLLQCIQVRLLLFKSLIILLVHLQSGRPYWDYIRLNPHLTVRIQALFDLYPIFQICAPPSSCQRGALHYHYQCSQHDSPFRPGQDGQAGAASDPQRGGTVHHAGASHHVLPQYSNHGNNFKICNKLKAVWVLVHGYCRYCET